MDINIIKQYKEELEEKKNILLMNYKDLVVAYESLRQLYEKLIAEYELETDTDADTDNDTELELCSRIKATNHSSTSINWTLVTLEGHTLYTSNDCFLGQSSIIDLQKLPISVGTKFILKAISKLGDDDTSDVILQYSPTSNGTAMFDLIGLPLKDNLKFIGVSY